MKSDRDPGTRPPITGLETTSAPGLEGNRVALVKAATASWSPEERDCETIGCDVNCWMRFDGNTT